MSFNITLPPNSVNYRFDLVHYEFFDFAHCSACKQPIKDRAVISRATSKFNTQHILILHPHCSEAIDRLFVLNKRSALDGIEEYMALDYADSLTDSQAVQR